MSKHYLTRRQILKAAAGAAFVGPLIVPARALGQESPSDQITMGCIGVGSMGSGNMRGFLSRDDVRVLAVCDVDENHLEEARNHVNNHYDNEDCDAYTDFRDLVARDDIDAVMIATPDHWHCLTALAAVRAGKDVYCEKPLAHTHEEGMAVVEAVRQHEVVWQTGSQQRSSGNFRRGVELVRNGVIGELEHVEVGLPSGSEGPTHSPEDPPEHVDYDFYCGPAEKIPFDPQRFHWDWRWHLNFGGGQLMDWINHHNDIAHWGMNMDNSGPLEVEATGEFPPEDSAYNAPYHYTFDCVYPNGVTVNVSDSNQMGARFHGTNGWVYVNRGHFSASEEEWTADDFDAGPIQVYHSNDHRGNFIECVKSRKPTICPPHVSHRSCTPGWLAYASMFTGRKVRWDPAREEILDDSEAAEYLKFDPRGDWSLDA
ncbi:MAG: Gfo/Idh/MocA family oxidoreductase [Candidatus Hydrogenedentota bacterium]